MLSFDALVAFEHDGNFLWGETDMAELEGLIMKPVEHVGALVDVCHQVAAGEEGEEGASGLFDSHAHARHDCEVFVGLHLDASARHNQAECASEYNRDINVLGIVDLFTGIDDRILSLVEIIHDGVFPVIGREIRTLCIRFSNKVSF